jgi:ectoine hydroxylase-related dioxygenase (phytanoyl-CoA dioxygenase family)
MATLQTVNASSATAEEINTILQRDGCLVVTNVLTTGEISQLHAELDAGFSTVPVCEGPFFGFATKRISSVLACSERSRRLAIHPIVLAVMDRFLLKSCRQYQLNLTQGIRILPGEPAQILHTDDLMFPFDLPSRGDQKMINCMWAVDDFTADNGATHLAPGSHHWDRDRQAERQEIVQGVMPAGSVLIYFGSLQHGGGANKSDGARTGLVLSYCLGWLRQAENHYLALPRELVRTFPQRLQRLVGYFVHEPNLGAVEGRDPLELMRLDHVGGQRFEEFLPEEVRPLLEEYHRSRAA